MLRTPVSSLPFGVGADTSGLKRRAASSSRTATETATPSPRRSVNRRSWSALFKKHRKSDEQPDELGARGLAAAAAGGGGSGGGGGGASTPHGQFASTATLASRRATGGLWSPPAWIPDRDAASCSECKSAFTTMRRRHHCRACGSVVCTRCSKHRIKLPGFGRSKGVRVCSSCHESLGRNIHPATFSESAGIGRQHPAVAASLAAAVAGKYFEGNSRTDGGREHAVISTQPDPGYLASSPARAMEPAPVASFDDGSRPTNARIVPFAATSNSGCPASSAATALPRPCLSPQPGSPVASNQDRRFRGTKREALARKPRGSIAFSRRVHGGEDKRALRGGGTCFPDTQSGLSAHPLLLRKVLTFTPSAQFAKQSPGKPRKQPHGGELASSVGEPTPASNRSKKEKAMRRHALSSEATRLSEEATARQQQAGRLKPQHAGLPSESEQTSTLPSAAPKIVTTNQRKRVSRLPVFGGYQSTSFSRNVIRRLSLAVSTRNKIPGWDTVALKPSAEPAAAGRGADESGGGRRRVAPASSDRKGTALDIAQNDLGHSPPRNQICGSGEMRGSPNLTTPAKRQQQRRAETHVSPPPDAREKTASPVQRALSNVARSVGIPGKHRSPFRHLGGKFLRRSLRSTKTAPNGDGIGQKKISGGAGEGGLSVIPSAGAHSSDDLSSRGSSDEDGSCSEIAASGRGNNESRLFWQYNSLDAGVPAEELLENRMHLTDRSADVYEVFPRACRVPEGPEIAGLSTAPHVADHSRAHAANVGGNHLVSPLMAAPALAPAVTGPRCLGQRDAFPSVEPEKLGAIELSRNAVVSEARHAAAALSSGGAARNSEWPGEAAIGAAEKNVSSRSQALNKPVVIVSSRHPGQIGTLYVTIESAEVLTDRYALGSISAYCSVRFEGCEFRTRVAGKSMSPVYREGFILPVHQNFSTIEFSMVDYGTGNAIGTYEANLLDLLEAEARALVGHRDSRIGAVPGRSGSGVGEKSGVFTVALTRPGYNTAVARAGEHAVCQLRLQLHYDEWTSKLFAPRPVPPQIQEPFEMAKMRANMSRLSAVFTMVTRSVRVYNDLMNWKKPMSSALYVLMLILTCVFMDAERWLIFIPLWFITLLLVNYADRRAGCSLLRLEKDLPVHLQTHTAQQTARPRSRTADDERRPAVHVSVLGVRGTNAQDTTIIQKASIGVKIRYRSISGHYCSDEKSSKKADEEGHSKRRRAHSSSPSKASGGGAGTSSRRHSPGHHAQNRGPMTTAAEASKVLNTKKVAPNNVLHSIGTWLSHPGMEGENISSSSLSAAAHSGAVIESRDPEDQIANLGLDKYLKYRLPGAGTGEVPALAGSPSRTPGAARGGIDGDAANESDGNRLRGRGNSPLKGELSFVTKDTSTNVLLGECIVPLRILANNLHDGGRQNEIQRWFPVFMSIKPLASSTPTRPSSAPPMATRVCEILLRMQLCLPERNQTAVSGSGSANVTGTLQKEDAAAAAVANKKQSRRRSARNGNVAGDSILAKYRKLKIAATRIQNRMGHFCTLVEHVRNLLNWTHPRKTRLVLLLMLFVLLVCCVVPSRYLVLLEGLRQVTEHFRPKGWIFASVRFFLSCIPNDVQVKAMLKRHALGRVLLSYQTLTPLEYAAIVDKERAIWAGHLRKRGQFRTNWRRRFFILARQERGRRLPLLRYWQRVEHAHPTGPNFRSGPCGELTIDTARRSVLSSEVGNSADSNAFFFAVEGGSMSAGGRRVLLLAADDRQHKESLLGCLKALVADPCDMLLVHILEARNLVPSDFFMGKSDPYVKLSMPTMYSSSPSLSSGVPDGARRGVGKREHLKKKRRSKTSENSSTYGDEKHAVAGCDDTGDICAGGGGLRQMEKTAGSAQLLRRRSNSWSQASLDAAPEVAVGMGGAGGSTAFVSDAMSQNRSLGPKRGKLLKKREKGRRATSSGGRVSATADFRLDEDALKKNNASVFTTKVIKRSLDPVWNESFVCLVHNGAGAGGREARLKLDVMDCDIFTRDDHIGEAWLRIPPIHSKKNVAVDTKVRGASTSNAWAPSSTSRTSDATGSGGVGHGRARSKSSTSTSHPGSMPTHSRGGDIYDWWVPLEGVKSGEVHVRVMRVAVSSLKMHEVVWHASRSGRSIQVERLRKLLSRRHMSDQLWEQWGASPSPY